MRRKLVPVTALVVTILAIVAARAGQERACRQQFAAIQPNPPYTQSSARAPRRTSHTSWPGGHRFPGPGTYTQRGIDDGISLPEPGSGVRRGRYSPYRELSPIDEVDRAVALTDEQRPFVTALVTEREALMRASYADAVFDGDVEAGVESVTRIYGQFDEKIRAALSPDQQVAYDAGRREGRIGAPLFVFRYGE